VLLRAVLVGGGDARVVLRLATQDGGGGPQPHGDHQQPHEHDGPAAEARVGGGRLVRPGPLSVGGPSRRVELPGPERLALGDLGRLVRV
jgi:hypothetical protein